jgi:hypothetical protein
MKVRRIMSMLLSFTEWQVVMKFGLNTLAFQVTPKVIVVGFSI